MTPTVLITCKIAPTDASAPLGLEAWVDDHKFFDSEHVAGPQELSAEINDIEGVEHQLRFVLKNKLPQHTCIDEHGQITADALIRISDLAFDGIELGHMACKASTYIHNFNGSLPLTQEKFYGEMGCNGTATIKFTTPLYLWLLENM